MPGIRRRVIRSIGKQRLRKKNRRVCLLHAGWLDHESESGLDRGSAERDELYEAVVGSLVALLAQEALGLALAGALGDVDQPARPVRLLAEAADAVAPGGVREQERK